MSKHQSLQSILHISSAVVLSDNILRYKNVSFQNSKISFLVSEFW